MKNKIVIFVVEDDLGFNKLLTTYLESKKKWEVHSFLNGEDCLNKLDLKPDIVLEDYDLPKMDGIKVMQNVKKLLPKTEFIFLSGQSNIKVAVEALQLGAYDYIVKDTNAKENAVHKIDQIVTILNLVKNKEFQKKSQLIIISVLLLTWMLVIWKMFFT
jgi:DNA-binding NtrC family response regulator